MAVNDIGVNLIQVESNTAPSVDPVEIGVLGICGKFYRGTRLMQFRGAGQDVLNSVFTRLGTPYENFRNPAYYNTVGHIQNSAAIGSILFINRVRANDAVAARTFRDSSLTGINLTQEANWNQSNMAMRVNKLSTNISPNVNISHSYDETSNSYLFRFSSFLDLPTNNITYNYRIRPSKIFIEQVDVNNPNFGNNVATDLQFNFLGVNYSFEINLSGANSSKISAGQSLSGVDLDVSASPVAIWGSNTISANNNPFSNLELTTVIPGGRATIHVTEVEIVSTTGVNILNGGEGYTSAPTINFSYPLPTGVTVVAELGTTIGVDDDKVVSIQFKNSSLDVPVTIASNSFEDAISSFPILTPSSSRFLIEEYRDASLERIANAINSGQPIDGRRIVYSTDNSIVTTASDIDVSNEFINSPSRLISVDVVTQALGLPISSIANTLFTTVYSVPVTGRIGRYYYSAGQNDEEDWGAWGNLLSITVSESAIDPTFRKVSITYKREGQKRVVEEFEDSEASIISSLKSSNYIKLNLHPSNTVNFLPFNSGFELLFSAGRDGTLDFQDFLGNPQSQTGCYAFSGTSATSICCPDATSGFENFTQQQQQTIIDTYASEALTSYKTAIFTLPRGISRDGIFSYATRNFLKDRSHLILYRANGSVPDGRGSFINVSLVGHIHGAAYVRWRLSRSIFPNPIPKGEPCSLFGVFGLDKETYSQSEITDYVRNLGVNPIALSNVGFIPEGARTMSRRNVHYSIHATELTNFYAISILRFAGFLKSEFNFEATQRRFSQRITDFTRRLYDANCLDTEGGFGNNFQIKVDASNNPTAERRKRIFNANIKIRWIEQIEAINIFLEKTDEGVNAEVS